jgi:hypothetical protein
MSCEIFECCQFFKDNLRQLPKTAEYIKSKLCHGEFQKCSRYMIFKELGSEAVPFHLNPDDVEQVKKIRECYLQRQNLSKK